MHHQTESAQQRLLDPLSTKWIENAAGVSRDTVAAWRRDRKPRADQWDRFIAAFNAWREGLPDTAKEPPPEERLDVKLDIALWALNVSPEEQADLLVRRAQGEAWPRRAAAAEPHEGEGRSANAPQGPSAPRGR